jgi:hypothetical protein
MRRSAKLDLLDDEETKTWSAYRKPAYAMDRVAEPAPSLALTTSSPPNWTPMIQVSFKPREAGSFLHTIDQSIKLVCWNLNLRASLAEEWNDCFARVTTNDWDRRCGWISRASDFLHKGFGSNHV